MGVVCGSIYTDEVYEGVVELGVCLRVTVTGWCVCGSRAITRVPFLLREM